MEKRDRKESAPVSTTFPPPASAPETTGAPREGSGEDWRDRYLRLAAEFDNFRKRRAREADEIRARAAERLIEDLLPTLDHFEMAVASAPKELEAGFRAGLGHVLASFRDALGRSGLSPVEPRRGDAFDPLEHEAVERASDPDVPAGSVARVVVKGYRLRGRLLRPARVVVAAASSAPEAARSRTAAREDD